MSGDTDARGKPLGNEGALLPTDGSGRIPRKYWQAVEEAAKAAEKAGLLNTEKDRKGFLESIRNILTPNQGLAVTEAVPTEVLVAKYLEASKNPVEFEGLRTGLPTLDSTLLGVQDQNFLVICARTGVGKTLVANYMVAHFATQGQKILYLALEENEMEVGDRWAKILTNNNITVPDGSVNFLYAEHISAIKEDKYNIIPMLAAAKQLGYTMVCVDMLNNLIDTVRDEDGNVFLNRFLDAAHQTGMTVVMTARLRQPLSDQEKDFPSMESVYGRVDLGYIVSKCIGVTQMDDEGDGTVTLRLHVIKNRRKQIGMKAIYPKIKVNNLLGIQDVGDDITAPELIKEYEEKKLSGGGMGKRNKNEPILKGDTNGIKEADFMQ